MMPDIKNGGPAFPIADGSIVHGAASAAIQGVTDSAERDRLYIEAAARASSGMTLRDYFAAKALQTLMRNPDTTFEEDAQDAYAAADEMISARARGAA
jgi:hypothetical protein